MRILWIGLAGVLLVAVTLVLYIRLAPSDPAVWHVDPDRTPDPATPNFARADLIIPLPPDEVAARIAVTAMGERAIPLAGEGPFVTWLSRTPLMRYPDYVSIRLHPVEGGTRLVALSRSRFGQGDMGANRARLDRWLAGLPRGM
jgi:hypothetical protein